MRITIDSMIRLQDVPAEILKKIQAELTIENPQYYVMKRIKPDKKWLWGEKVYKLWTERDVDGEKVYVITRGYMDRVMQIFRESDCKCEFIDNRLELPPVKFKSKIQLREYQAPIIPEVEFNNQGSIIMPCGSGKTETALEVVAHRGQPTLWITHTKDLLQQSMNRAIDKLGLTGEQIGVIMADTFKVGSHITFATVQTLSKRDLSKIVSKFGCLVVDECHHCFKDSSNFRMFESVISQFPAYFRYGLTASEHRSDGLIETMFHIIGPKVYEIDQNDPRIPIVKPKVYFIETGFKYDVGTHMEQNEDGELEEIKDMLNVRQLINAMAEDDNRNKLIRHCLSHQKAGDFVLVLGDSLEQLRDFKTFIECLDDLPVAFVCGTTPKQQREKIMSDIRAGRYNFLFATYALAKEGLDIPRLDTLVLVTPKKDKTVIQQAVGRIMRPFEGKKQPVVYDFFDKDIPQCRGWARDRKKVYMGLNCEVEGGPKIRRTI